MPKKTNNKAIKPIQSVMLRALNGEARKHGTLPTDRFRLSQISVNILYQPIRIGTNPDGPKSQFNERDSDAIDAVALPKISKRNEKMV